MSNFHDVGRFHEKFGMENVTNGGVSAEDFAIPAGYTENEPEMHGPPGRHH